MALSLKNFLQEFPLYRKFHGEVPKYRKIFDANNLQLACDTCSDMRTFRHRRSDSHVARQRAVTEINIARSSGDSDIADDSVFTISYACTDCNNCHYYFLLHIGSNYEYIEKAGQYPAQDISISKALQQALGDQAPVYKHGLVSERNGFGIGAFAYYRRVLEERIGNLLNELEQVFPDAERETYKQILIKVREQHTAEDRLKLVKDFVPAYLRTGDIEPLGTLYAALSQGLHSKSEDDCLANAELIRLCLGNLIEEIDRNKTVKKEFTDRARRLIEKNAKS